MTGKYSIDRLTIGNLIKITRIQKGLTQDELGQKLGVKKARICRIESGNANLSIESIISIFIALGIKAMLYIDE